MHYKYSFLFCFILLFAFLSQSPAATYTWSGNAGANIWTDPNQWNPITPGPNFTDASSNAGDNLIFGASAQTTVNLRANGGTAATNEDKINTLTFNAGAPAYNFISASDSPAGTAHDIDLYGNMINNSSNQQTFSTGIVLHGPITVTGANGDSSNNVAFEAGDHLVLNSNVTYNGPFDLHVSGTSSNSLRLVSAAVITINNAKIVTEGGISSSNSYNIAGNGTLVINGGGWNSSNLTKSGEGTLEINGATVSNTDVSIRNGALRIGNNNALGTTNKNINLPSSTSSFFAGKLQLSNNISVTNSISLPGRQMNIAAVVDLENFSGTNTFSGPVNFGPGGGQYNFGSLSGKLIVSSDLSFPVLFPYSSMRTLTFRGAGDGEFSGGLGNFHSISETAVTQYGTGNLTLSGSNNFRLGHLMSIGGGTLTLGATFGNTGFFDTTIYPLFGQNDDRDSSNPIQFQLLNNSKIDVSQAANLRVPSTSSFGLNRTLAGNGTFIGDVMTSPADSANLSNPYRNASPNGKAAFKPGNVVAYDSFDSSHTEIDYAHAFVGGVGKLTIQGNLDMLTTGSSDDLEWHLGALKDNQNGTPGVDWDLLRVLGDTKLGTNDTFSLGSFTTISGVIGPGSTASNSFWNSTHSWKVLDTDTNSSGDNDFLFAPGTVTHFNSSGGFGGGDFSLVLGSGLDAGDVFLIWTIPEPSSYALAAIALVGLSCRLRRGVSGCLPTGVAQQQEGV